MSPRKPAWPPSLKLMPQHLEAREEYLEGLVAFRLGLTSQMDFGLVGLEVNDAALARGEVVVTNLVVVFPGGGFVKHKGELRCSLNEALGEIGATADVFVSWPERSLDGASVVDEAAATTARWRRDDEALIPFVRIAPASVPPTHESVRIGRFERGGNGVRFVEEAVPPLLSIHAFPPLRTWLAGIIEAVQARVAELVAARASTPLEPTRFAISQAPALHLLSLLQRHAVRLLDMQSRRIVHPRELYDVLVALVGGLSAVSDARPEAAPHYDHAAPGPALRELIEHLEQLLARSARDNVLSFPFKRIDETTFRARLLPDAFIGRRPFLVATGADEQTLRDRVPSLAKIASGAAIGQLLQSAVRGVNLAVEFDPPPGLPTRRSFVCYRLDTRDRHWADIRERLDMVVHLPIASKTLELTLYALE